MNCSGCGKLHTSDDRSCAGCGMRLESASPSANTGFGAAAVAAPAQMIDASQSEYIASRLSPELERLQGIGGWLMWFCFVLIFLQPLMNFSEAVRDSSISALVFAIFLSALSITTGTLVYRRKPAAFPWLKWYFGVYLAIMVLAAVGEASQGFSKGMLGEVRGVLFVLVWGSYFMKSKRVFANFGRNL
jgi:hypothetical protein